MRSSHLEYEIPQQAVVALKAALGDRLAAVVLFGSRAHGEARADSDWDLMAIARDLPENRFDRQLPMNRFLLELWRSCVDNSQLASENAAKAVLALIGPVSRTHNPAVLLLEALEGGRARARKALELAEDAVRLTKQVIEGG